MTWRGVLKPDEIHAVASYIYTLRGTHPPNPKPPENQRPARPAQVRLNSQSVHELSRHPMPRPGPVKDVDWKDFRDHSATADQEGRRQWLYPRNQGRFYPRAHVC